MDMNEVNFQLHPVPPLPTWDNVSGVHTKTQKFTFRRTTYTVDT